jgi:hypothetical protein
MSNEEGVTPFEEAVKASPGKESSILGKGTQDLGGFPKLPTWARLDKTERYTGKGLWSEAVSKPWNEEAYASQRLNLAVPWEGSWTKGQGFEPDLRNSAVRDYRGA